MNLAQVLTVLLLGRLRGSSQTLRMKVVQDWIDEHANAEAYGRGYVGGTGVRRGPSRAFIEVRRTKQGSRYTVEASAYLHPPHRGARQEWRNVELDRDLEKFFGRQNKVRVDF